MRQEMEKARILFPKRTNLDQIFIWTMYCAMWMEK